MSYFGNTTLYIRGQDLLEKTMLGKEEDCIGWIVFNLQDLSRSVKYIGVTMFEARTAHKTNTDIPMSGEGKREIF